MDETYGVPVSIAISKGAINDAIVAINQMQYNLLTDYDPKRVQFNNRFKPNILGDSHYYHNKFKTMMKRKKYNIFTDVNIRNTQDKDKLEKIEKDKKKYDKVKRKRAIKEISFSWLHKYPKLNRFIEKKISSYAG